MEELTDEVFRYLVWERGAPDVFVTEFVRVEDVERGRNRNAQRRTRADSATPGIPLVVQIYGTDPEAFRRASALLSERGFSGIDLNMGCPARRIRARGAGSGLIREPALAKEIVLAAREGAKNLPVSVKTRLGWDCYITEDWVGFLLELDLPVLSLHARTAVQAYSGQADWTEIGRAVRLRDSLGKGTLIIGNGDLATREQGLVMARLHGCDGLMVGRAVLSNPWFWNPMYPDLGAVSVTERLAGIQRHLRLFLERYGEERNVHLMKKFIALALSELPEWATQKKNVMSALTAEDLGDELRGFAERLGYEAENGGNF